MRTFVKIFILITVLASAGCKNNGAVDAGGMPQKLVIGMVESEKIQQVKDAREKIRLYLESKLKMPVEVFYSTDYVGIIEALRAHKIHMAEMPPFAYVIATRSLQLTPLVTLGSNGKPVSYRSVIIAGGGSRLKTMADIKANAKKLTFCFTDPASTSGHLIPRAYLNSIGLNPNTAFKQTVFAGSHSAATLSVKSGKIDVGCTTDLIFNIMKVNKLLNDGDIRVIWTSALIVSDPIVIRNDVNRQLAKKIQQAYIDMNTEKPEILSGLIKIFFKDTVQRSYMKANDSLFNGLRKIANGVKDLKAN